MVEEEKSREDAGRIEGAREGCIGEAERREQNDLQCPNLLRSHVRQGPVESIGSFQVLVTYLSTETQCTT